MTDEEYIDDFEKINEIIKHSNVGRYIFVSEDGFSAVFDNKNDLIVLLALCLRDLIKSGDLNLDDLDDIKQAVIKFMDDEDIDKLKYNFKQLH